MGDMKNGEEPPPPTGCCTFFWFQRSRSAPTTKAIDQVEPAKSVASSNSSEFKQSESDKASLLVPVNPKPPSNPSSASHKPARQQQQHHHPQLPQAKVQKKNEASPRLNNMRREGRKSKKRGNLIRASSSNVMLFGNLGNVRGKKNSDISQDVLDYLPKTAKELSAEAKNNDNKKVEKELDAEELKEMGNEEYKKGRYVEAVALYRRAIAKDPNKASYWSNKAAALLGLGQLIEAVGDCRTAVKIDPSYCRAHYRLASLYLRLGDADKAVNHYKLSQTEANPDDMSKAQALQTNLAMADEAQKLKDWSSLLKLTQGAISSGADSAPQVFALQAEALLNLQRHEEADAALSSSPTFDIDASTKFFGVASTAHLLAVRAQVDMATGRFEDAVVAAEKATQLDPNNRDLCSLSQKALVVTSARLKGNDLFKASKFSDACTAYGEGLEHDPHNAILLCNRAACYSKLSQWEKAIEDCNTALKFCPSYNKARLRRAHCNYKLEMWEAAVEDYEILLRQMPGDEEVIKALFEAHVQLKMRLGEGMKDSKNDDGGWVHVVSEEHFKNIVTLPGLSVAMFFNKSSENSENTLPFVEQTLKQFPSVKFLKVDMDEIDGLAKSEHTSTMPGFKIYQNGSNVKDIPGSDFNQLDSYIKSLNS